MKHIQRQQFSFTKTSIKVPLKILVYVFHFVSRFPVFAFSKMNSRQENHSKRSFTAICGEKMSKGFLKFYKLIIKPDTRSDQILELKTCIN